MTIISTKREVSKTCFRQWKEMWKERESAEMEYFKSIAPTVTPEGLSK